MKFLAGQIDGKQAVYLVTGNDAVNLSEQDARIGSDLSGIIEHELSAADIEALAVKGNKADLSAITPALPVANPGKTICLGLNYVDHIKEGGYDIPTYPVFFMRSTTSLMAADAPMVVPACSEQLDYEAELMVIIGKKGRHIAEEDALDYVFGYSIFNDGSIREYQRKTHQWTAGKNFDDTGAIGPIVVTPDELPAGALGLKIESRVGDEILQSATTSDMLWTVEKTIAAISEFSTLMPGDMIAMGTPPGVGHAKTPQRWLRPGETVDVEIEGIGICSSPIVAEKDMARSEAAE